MTWMTWRQFRVQGSVLWAVLALLAAVLAVTGPGIADRAAGIDREAFLAELSAGLPMRLYLASTVLLFVLPGIVGLFVGVPLVARELEAGTHRLAWTQSVTRTRWLAVRLGLVGGAVAVSAGLCSLAVSWWADPIDTASLERLQPHIFAARGIVPVAYALFAFAAGVLAGVVLRRSVPAMAVTLALVAAVQLVMPLAIRGGLIPAEHTTTALDVREVRSLGIRPGGEVTIIGGFEPEGGWVVSNRTVTATGDAFSGLADRSACSREQMSPQPCLDALEAAGLWQDVVYHPAGHFWPLQWAESGLLLAAAGLFVWLTFWWVRRRLT